MNYRDHLAFEAMKRIMDKEFIPRDHTETLAEQCYAIADAMLLKSGGANQVEDDPLHRGNMDPNLHGWIMSALKSEKSAHDMRTLAGERLATINDLQRRLDDMITSRDYYSEQALKHTKDAEAARDRVLTVERHRKESDNRVIGLSVQLQLARSQRDKMTADRDNYFNQAQQFAAERDRAQVRCVEAENQIAIVKEKERGIEALTSFLSRDSFSPYYLPGDRTWDAAIKVIRGQADELAKRHATILKIEGPLSDEECGAIRMEARLHMLTDREVRAVDLAVRAVRAKRPNQ